jgi:hypothetical protein
MIKMNFGNVAPSFMIIGTQKGGTTALHEYLIQHPKLIAPKKKELHFFDTYNKLDFKRYLKQFPKKYLTNKISFESTPRYLYYPGVARNIYRYNSKMKLIILLRDPVKRAYSAWNMYKQMSMSNHMVNFFKKNEEKCPNEQIYTLLCKTEEFPAFEEWTTFELENEVNAEWIEPSIIRRGYYSEQIKEYLKIFDREQLLFIDSETLKKDTLGVLNTVAYFLEIPDFNGMDLNLEPKHKREYSEPLNEMLYDDLLKHFQNKNKGLEELTNLKLDWMNQNTDYNV